MAQRHRELEDVLLQEDRSTTHFLIYAQELLVGLLLFSLLFLVLNDQTAFVRVEVLEDEAVCKLRIELNWLCPISLLFM